MDQHLEFNKFVTVKKFQDLNNFIYNENYYKLIFGKTKIGYVHRK